MGDLTEDELIAALAEIREIRERAGAKVKAIEIPYQPPSAVLEELVRPTSFAGVSDEGLCLPSLEDLGNTVGLTVPDGLVISGNLTVSAIREVSPPSDYWAGWRSRCIELEAELAEIRDHVLQNMRLCTSSSDGNPLAPTTIEILRDTAAWHKDTRSDLWELRSLVSMTEQPRDIDYHGPVKDGQAIPDPVHEQFHRAVGDVLAGKVIPSARKQMRDALDKAPTGEKTMPERAVRLVRQDVGIRLP
jgi:hypothetical protein